jgi:nitrile hydratase
MTDGAHDLGGQAGHGAIAREADGAPFHHEWELRVFALNRTLLAARVYNLDEFRYAQERLPRETYQRASYYERWLLAIERLLHEKRVLP